MASQPHMQDQGTPEPVSSGPRGTNQSGMRAYNEKLILTLLRRQGALAKSDVTRQTGLSAQTVSVIMRRLEGEGLVVRGEPQRGRIGQPSIPMTLDPNGVLSLGLKIGRRSTELVLTNFIGEVVDRMARRHRYPHPGEAMEFAHHAIAEIMARLDPVRRGRIAGLGIAMPFYLWNWARALGVPDETMKPWRGTDIRGEIAARYDFPVFLENDASSACSAEVAFGPPDSPRDYLYFYVGFFVGGGVVLNGSLFTGPGGNSGALGPMPVASRDGTVRQLIEVASLSVLEKQLVAAGHETGSIWEAAEGWDIDANILDQWIDSAGAGLAQAVTAACSLIDFTAVVLDGWIPREVRARLVAAVSRHLDDMTMIGLERPAIREGTVGADARVLGAASHPLFDRYLLAHGMATGEAG